MLQRSSVILALLYYKKYIVDPELEMTSNFGQAWKDLPFNNIVHLVAYSNKNLAEISRKCRMQISLSVDLIDETLGGLRAHACNIKQHFLKSQVPKIMGRMG
jgi:hypothetical protein